MQQTQKYQFNLIESSDTFSAQPLNDNMAKVEAALAAADAAVETAKAAANSAVAAHRSEVNAALSTHQTQVNAALSAQAAKVAALPRIITGSYTGTGEYGEDHPKVLEFPDAERPPSVILVSSPDNSHSATMIRGMARCLVYTYMYDQCFLYPTWTDKGVRWYSTDGANSHLNYLNKVYSYAAFF